MKNIFSVLFTLLILNLASAAPPQNWPPMQGNTFPKSAMFLDHKGKEKSLRSLNGKVAIIHFIGMTCPACNAFSGGNDLKKKFNNITPQKNLEAFSKSFEKYAKVGTLKDHRKIKYIHLLLFNLHMKTPTQEDANLWRDFYKKNNGRNFEVWIPKEDLTSVSNPLVPGFALVDKNGKVVSIVGNGKESLWTDMFPKIKNLM